MANFDRHAPHGWGADAARAFFNIRSGYTYSTINAQGKTMKDVKVDVRVNVGVDMAGVVLLLASAAMALFFYKQNKQEKTALPS
jgi:hypothetical protein